MIGLPNCINMGPYWCNSSRMSLIIIILLLFSGNPLICNCHIIWLKSWLSESSSIGPKCADGTYVKGMPFGRNDCSNTAIKQIDEEDLRACMIHENAALLPNLATSQVYSTLDKIKDYTSQIKNTYQANKINRPSPEESDYFYDEYVDYPYNETLIDGLNNEVSVTQNTNRSGSLPTIYAAMNNTADRNKQAPTNKPNSGFTFFGMDLPPLDMGKLLNSGRKIDWPDKKNSHTHSHSHNHGGNKYQLPEPPKFETGGFSPILPTTAGGFRPIPDPTLNVSHTAVQAQSATSYNKQDAVGQAIAAVSTKPPVKTAHNNTTHSKIKSEIHELQAYIDDDNSTHVAYNRTKNVEEQKSDPNNLSKYNLMESNLTITQVTEKESMLITTDTSNDMSLQAWMESSTSSYTSSTAVTSKPPMKKHIETAPTALSAVLVPTTAELHERNLGKRPATITKVNLPNIEHYDHRENFSANREPKTRFSEILTTGNTKTRQIGDNDWYYKNYNNSNLEPYIAPGVHKPTSKSNINLYNKNILSVMLFYTMNRIL